MARPHRITQLGYEQKVADMLEAGEIGEDILESINEDIARRIEEGERIPGGEVSRSAYQRYIATLRKDVMARVHEPKMAREVSEKSLDVITRVRKTIDHLDELMEDALAEQDVFSGGRNWTAIIGVIQEARRQSTLYVDVMEKVYNAQQIATFQEVVMDAIREVDPEVARAIQRKLREKLDMRKAALLGL